MAKLNINGKVHDIEVESDTPLLWVIREQVGLTGTKYGCGVAQCGACSVHLNGEVARSCSIPVGSIKATDKTIGLFSQRNPVPEMAVFKFPVPLERIEIESRVRLAGTQRIVAVATMTDGVLYAAGAEVVVTIDACMDGT